MGAFLHLIRRLAQVIFSNEALKTLNHSFTMFPGSAIILGQLAQHREGFDSFRYGERVLSHPY